MDLEEYLQQFAEPTPEWLSHYLSIGQQGSANLLSALLKSRTVYYPGFGDDGDPIDLFNSTHAAHCFVYADYLISRENLAATINTWGFAGYQQLQQFEVFMGDLWSPGWERHYDYPNQYSFNIVQSYAIISIFERQPNSDNGHGARRFAVLFIGADAYETFDVIFCQNNGTPPPFCAVIQDHGLGGNWAPGGFGGCGPMAEIADRCGVFPHFLLKDIDEGRTRTWPSYVRCLAADGTAVRARPMGGAGHSRSLWQRPEAQDHHVPRA